MERSKQILERSDFGENAILRDEEVLSILTF
jgi:hypothetical protein